MREGSGMVLGRFWEVLNGFLMDFGRIGGRLLKFFGRILGEFGEVKILDFRCFFVIVSMQNFECNLEGQKIEKKGP